MNEVTIRLDDDLKACLALVKAEAFKETGVEIDDEEAFKRAIVMAYAILRLGE